ncbi:hypothetical protein GCM10007231_22250 [Nocardioides daphniae]|uniref:VWFA domain-containing protein n=1 Tax=Nocardioides daphniae TaxID=402297 RepID=A0ABQ1QE83_9ACTN|nr:hypothetical protein GCM10007231_22250 [Nocardioides daphniae]
MLSRFAARVAGRRDEKGAYAILFSMVLVLLIALAAISVDIASQVSARQQLKDTLDAAAHAGAYALPEQQGDIQTIVGDMARANDINTSVTTDLWCVIASTGATKAPQYTQIPTTCNPHGTRPYVGTKCDEFVCFIPCDPSRTASTGGAVKCNTVRVADSKVVPYAFAPAIGYDEGNTGAVVSIACKGTCGNDVPNPLDILVMADRTPSMVDGDREQMKAAIESSLTVMNPELQYVALGTIHKSDPRRMNKLSTEVCTSAESGVQQQTSSSWPYSPLWNTDNTPKLETTNSPTSGSWIASPFSNGYLTGPSGTIVATDPLVKSVKCMPGAKSGNYGTHLASALKGGARYLLGNTPNNLSSLPARPGPAPKKVIIFETDGSPDEVLTNGYYRLSNSTDFGAGRNATYGQQGCNNLEKMADEVKAKDVLIITIGFGAAVSNTSTGRCISGNTSTSRLRDVLARVASKAPDGNPSTASDCSDPVKRTQENADGDYFFCAASGSELETIFRSAFGSLSKGIKLMKMPA